VDRRNNAIIFYNSVFPSFDFEDTWDTGTLCHVSEIIFKIKNNNVLQVQVPR
jgi:hypothetical protein